jgi:hypothetical protein
MKFARFAIASKFAPAANRQFPHDGLRPCIACALKPLLHDRIKGYVSMRFETKYCRKS